MFVDFTNSHFKLSDCKLVENEQPTALCEVEKKQGLATTTTGYNPTTAIRQPHT